MIKHIKCDIFESGADIICHQVNCQGVMGSGIAKQVKNKYPKVYKEYKKRCDIYSPKAMLGTAQFVGTKGEYDTPFLGIFNLFGQEKFGYDGKCYTDYTALYKCFEKVKESLDLALTENKQSYTIAIPYLLGCARGGGSWDIVYKMIEEVFGNSNCEVLICEYNGG
jgi:O-acetyl-ADP-ribose deacetylase (regulator of RNase III)